MLARLLRSSIAVLIDEQCSARVSRACAHQDLMHIGAKDRRPEVHASQIIANAMAYSWQPMAMLDGVLDNFALFYRVLYCGR